MISIAKRLEKVFKKAEVDSAVVMNTQDKDSNFVYLTGLYGGSFEGSVLVANRRKATLLTSILEYEVALDRRPGEVEVVAVKGRKESLRLLRSLLEGKSVGVSGNFLPYNYYVALKKAARPKRMADISSAFAAARQVKEADEIERIGIANNIVKKAFSDIEGHLEEGVTERQVAGTFDNAMRRYGADSPSFNTIVCFGANAAVPHHVPTNAKLPANSLVLIDAGARYMGYCSDVTRTFIFKPDRSTQKYRRMSMMHETVARAQQDAFDKVREGAYADTIHKIAAARIDTNYNGMFKGTFIHALGHSVGIDVHDGPGFSPGEHYRLKEGMVISNEPGVYIKGFGGVRIEDDLLVMKNGARYL